MELCSSLWREDGEEEKAGEEKAAAGSRGQRPRKQKRVSGIHESPCELFMSRSDFTAHFKCLISPMMAK